MFSKILRIDNCGLATNPKAFKHTPFLQLSDGSGIQQTMNNQAD
jgi:hypothetical protein